MKSRSQIALILSLLAALLLIAGTVGAAPVDGPTVSLSVKKSEFRAAEEVLLSVTISNPTRHSVRILQWFTPGSQVEEPIFAVKVNGEPAAYTGAIYKRPAPTGSDYITLKSGESVTYSVALGEYYDLSRSGQYEIVYDVAAFNLFSEKGSSSEALKSEPISFKVEGRAPKGKPTPPPPPPVGGTTYSGCTDTQKATLVKARAQATTYAVDAKSYLDSINSGTQRYAEWFGTFSSARYNTVSSHFGALSTAWQTAGVNFDCSCKQNYYAYVYPSKPYNIYLCRVFWSAPLAGTDSKGGTLIHEMSHFNVVASTDDYVYGQTGARNLADTNPDNAVMNADNHEYFAENNPSLP